LSPSGGGVGTACHQVDHCLELGAGVAERTLDAGFGRYRAEQRCGDRLLVDRNTHHNTAGTGASQRGLDGGLCSGRLENCVRTGAVSVVCHELGDGVDGKRTPSRCTHHRIELRTDHPVTARPQYGASTGANPPGHRGEFPYATVTQTCGGQSRETPRAANTQPAVTAASSSVIGWRPPPHRSTRRRGRRRWRFRPRTGRRGCARRTGADPASRSARRRLIPQRRCLARNIGGIGVGVRRDLGVNWLAAGSRRRGCRCSFLLSALHPHDPLCGCARRGRRSIVGAPVT
jgi:hypothetical protein